MASLLSVSCCHPLFLEEGKKKGKIMPQWGFFIHYCSFPSSGTFTLVLFFFFILSPFIFHAYPKFPSSLKGTIFPVSSLEACLYRICVLNHSSSPLSVSVSSLKDRRFISPPRSFRFRRAVLHSLALFFYISPSP